MRSGDDQPHEQRVHEPEVRAGGGTVRARERGAVEQPGPVDGVPGRTVRICGLEVNVAYWMFVELETDVSACSADIVAEEMRACLGASVLIRKRCWLWNNRVVSVVFVGCKGVC